MQDFQNKKILLGICGGIAAYKSAYLVRELTRLGAEVRVVMTESAQKFIAPLSLQALSGHEVHVSLFDEDAERGMGHIALARWADYLVIAPASANCIAKFSLGLADDLLSTLYLATKAPVLLCPAMNQQMWAHEATQENCQRLQDRGVMIVGPDEGSQACGDFGLGRLVEVDAIINALRLYSVHRLLAGKKAIITAGPTREFLDPVRFLSNMSSGKMGYALAYAAKMAGAEVTLISGPCNLPVPQGVHCVPVISAEDMYSQVMANLSQNIIFIGCAAVADYRPRAKMQQKIKKEGREEMLCELEKNPDILKAVSQAGKASMLIGFAAETEQLLENAQKKLNSKQLNMIIANQVGESQDCGFDSDYNRVTVLSKNKQITLDIDNKIRLAGQIIAIIAASLQNNDF